MTISGEGSSSSGQVTVAFLIQRNVALEWQEVVAIALEIADVLARSGRGLLPTYQDLELTPDGTIRFLKDPTRSGDPVTALVSTFSGRFFRRSHQPTCGHLFRKLDPMRRSTNLLLISPRCFARFESSGRRDVLARVYGRALETPLMARHHDPGTQNSEPRLPVRMLRTDEILTHDALESRVPQAVLGSIRKHGLLPPILVRQSEAGYELVAGSRWLSAAKAADLTRLPCQVCDVDDEEAQVLLELDRLEMQEARGSSSGPDWAMVLGPTLGEIADSLGAAKSCWGLSAEGPGRPYHRTVSEVTRVELQRVTWIVEGLRALGKRPVLDKRTQNLGALLDRVFQATQPERRLANIRLLANLSEASIVLTGDERLLIMAYGGALQAMLTLVSQAKSAVVRCEVIARDSAAVVEFSQDRFTPAHPLLDRFFDESYHGRPGGYGAAVALAAARRVMELHGGSATTAVMESGGFRIVMRLPL